MAKDLRRGDRVSWKSHGSTAVGRVVRKLTEPTTVKGHRAKASEDDPQYLVETDDGSRAAHRPSALRRLARTGSSKGKGEGKGPSKGKGKGKGKGKEAKASSKGDKAGAGSKAKGSPKGDKAGAGSKGKGSSKDGPTKGSSRSGRGGRS